MAANNEVNIQVKATDKASSEFKKIEQNAGGLGSKLGALGGPLKAIGIGVAAVGGAAVIMGKQFIDAANESIRIETQLNQVIKSTGGAAGLTAEEVKNMASSLQAVTTIGDDAILAGQNMLLTFTGIGKEVFPQVTETMLDMATALNNGVTPSAEQLSAQAIMLGKALNDPAQGMTALTRVGVVFTDQQKEQITTLTEAGDVMGAQKVILAELSKEYGGQATAQAATYEGQVAQLSNTIGDVQETIGMALIPVLQDLFAELTPIIKTVAESTTKWFENEENIQKMKNTMSAFINVVEATVKVIGFITQGIFSFGESLGMATANIVIFVGFAGENFVKLGDTISNVWTGVKDLAIGVFEAMRVAIVEKFQSAIDFVNGALAKVQKVWEKISGVVSSIKSAASKVGAKVGDFVSGTKANGGDVMAGKSYMVGERGPERFVPSSSGSIVPNGGFSGNVSINMGGVTVKNEADEDRLVKKIKEELTNSLQMYKFGIS